MIGVGNFASPVTARINYVLAYCKLRYFLFTDSTGLRRPRPDFLTGIVIRVPTMGERYFFFPKKRYGNFFPRSPSPFLKTLLSYYLWCVKEKFTPIVLRIPSCYNFPGNISPRFCWLYKSSSPTSPYDFSSNHICICHPQYNRQDNARPCTLKAMTQYKQFPSLIFSRWTTIMILEGLG